MSILDQIYKTGVEVQSNLVDMNSALAAMGKQDKEEYRQEKAQRKYTKETAKRARQDKLGVYKKMDDIVHGGKDQARAAAQGNKFTEGLSAGVAEAVKQENLADAWQSMASQPSQQSPKGEGGSLGMIGPTGPYQSPEETTQGGLSPAGDTDRFVKLSGAKAEKEDYAALSNRVTQLEEAVHVNSPGMNSEEFVGHQSGGFAGAVPNLGQPTTGDHFYTHVQPGSYILNRNAVAAMGFQGGGTVPVALEQGEIALPPGTFDQKAMDFVNYEMFPRFQAGGMRRDDKRQGNGPPSEDTIAQGMVLPPGVNAYAKGGKVFLHWAATGYSGHSTKYHSTVQGDGSVTKTRDYNSFGGGHTSERNSEGIGISLAAMSDATDTRFGTHPVKPLQYEKMAEEVAKVGKAWEWTPADVDSKVITHAEAGRQGDSRGNYGPKAWGGTGLRWDLYKLYEGDAPGSGGPKIRGMIKKKLGMVDAMSEDDMGQTTDSPESTGGGDPASDPGTGGDPISEAVASVSPVAGFISQVFSAVSKELGLPAWLDMNTILAPGDGGGGGDWDWSGTLLSDPGANNTHEPAGTPGPEGPEPTGPTSLGNTQDEKLRKVIKLAMGAGFNEKNARIMGAIAGGESSFNPRAHNTKGADNSYGLWQINMLGDLGPARREQFGLKSNDELFDPKTNARAARAIYLERNSFKPWGAYTDGNAAKFMNAAKSIKLKQGGLVNMRRSMSEDAYKMSVLEEKQMQFESGAEGPIVVNAGGGGQGPTQPRAVFHSTGNNLPNYDLQARDSCPLSMYYCYNPSFNPRGVGL